MSAAADVGSLAEGLRRELGAPAVEEIELDLEGARLGLRIAPGPGGALGAALRLLGEAATPALVRGGGTRSAFGHPVPRARVLLETRALLPPTVVDDEDGIAYLPAGAALCDLREHVRKVSEGRWEIPLDPPGDSSTLGGCLAAAAAGPLHAAPRDAVLGLDVTLASGEPTRCGGRVVKNVAGYDLAKLYVGSLGTLGVIEGAWLRLQPAPEAREVWWAPVDDPRQALAAARAASTRVAAWLSREVAAELGAELGENRAGPALLVELAGDAPAVEAEARAWAGRAGAQRLEQGDPMAWLRARQGRPRGLRVRVASLASALAEVARILEEHGAQVLAYPARGELHADVDFSPGVSGDATVERILRGARLAARAGQGDFVVEDAPLAIREVREMFGDPEPRLALFRALKAQYDPRGILNPGRQAGRV
ncbi:MAG: hypothetical protein CL910_19855 [Deltaproteobacteria bacterium]|nr:hypothetical protein [Deltaproteobacteria bacterium]